MIRRANERVVLVAGFVSLPTVQSSHLNPLLDDRVDRLWIEPLVAQVASSFARTSPVTALALLRFLGRGVARTARRIADFSEGEEKTPVNPRHFVSVDQVASRRRGVHAGRRI